MSRKEQIDNFLEKWNEMLAAANEVDGFDWKFSVSISSDNSIIDDRVRTIIGINHSFTNHNMSWTSSSN